MDASRALLFHCLNYRKHVYFLGKPDYPELQNSGGLFKESLLAVILHIWNENKLPVEFLLMIW